MSEMALTAQHLIVIGRGELIADMGVEEFIQGASKQSVRVRSPQVAKLAELLAGPDVTIEAVEPSVVEVRGLDSERIGTAAAENAIVLYELTPQRASLEEAFMELTRDSLEFHTDGDGAIGAQPPDAEPPEAEPKAALA